MGKEQEYQEGEEHELNQVDFDLEEENSEKRDFFSLVLPPNDSARGRRNPEFTALMRNSGQDFIVTYDAEEWSAPALYKHKAGCVAQYDGIYWYIARRYLKNKRIKKDSPANMSTGPQSTSDIDIPLE